MDISRALPREIYFIKPKLFWLSQLLSARQFQMIFQLFDALETFNRLE